MSNGVVDKLKLNNHEVYQWKSWGKRKENVFIRRCWLIPCESN